MLVLTRRVGESLVIGNEITVTVLEVRGDQVRVGIAAPRHVQVHREEVFRELEAENASATAAVDRTRALVARMPPGVRPRPAPGGGDAGRPATPGRDRPPSDDAR